MKIINVVYLCFLIGCVCGNRCIDISGMWRSDQRVSNISIFPYEGFNAVFRGVYTENEEMRSRLLGKISLVEDGGSLVAFNSILSGEDTIIAWVGQCMICDGEEVIFTTWVERSKFLGFKGFEEKSISTRIKRETYRKVASPPDEQYHEVSNSGDPFIHLMDADIRGTRDSISGDDMNTSAAVPQENISDLRGIWDSTSGDRINITAAVSHENISGYHLTSPENPVELNGIVDFNTTFIVFGFASVGPTSIKGWTGHIFNPGPVDNVMETSWLNHTFTNSCSNPSGNVRFGQTNYSMVSSKSHIR